MVKKKEIEFPDCWEEVRPDEWACLLKLRHKLMTQRGVSLTDVKRAWCDFVLTWRGMRVRGTEGMLLVDRLADTLEWMWLVDDEAGCVSLRFDTTRNLLPVYKGLQGPASHGGDLTFGEFRAAGEGRAARGGARPRAEQHPLHGGGERGVRHGHVDRPHAAAARAAETAGRQAAGGRADEAGEEMNGHNEAPACSNAGA